MSLRYRFVGQSELPRSLTKLDVEDLFRLLPEDIAAIRDSHFQRQRYLGLALHLAYLRCTGCYPAKATAQPPALLQALCEQMGLNRTVIATLKAIYATERNVWEHRQWAREHCGFTPWGEHDGIKRLEQSLAIWAKTAASVDDLVHASSIWLFDNKLVHPGDRPVRDRARAAFTEVEEAVHAIVARAVPDLHMRVVLGLLNKPLQDDDGTSTALEWLKIIPGKAGPLNLREVVKRIGILKQLHVHEWDLNGIEPDRLVAFARKVVNRPPRLTFRLAERTLRTEVVCFLRYRLQELTDQTVFRVDRRISEIRRQATNKTAAKQVAKSVVYRSALQSVLCVAEDPALNLQERLTKIVELVKKTQLDDATTSEAAIVRETLSEQPHQVRPLLNMMLEALDIHGDGRRKSTKLLKALQAFRAGGTTSLPDDFDISLVGPVWEPLVADTDRSKAFQAFEACTMLSVREGLRGGHLWIPYSGRYRSREDCLITEEVWALKRDEFCSALGLPTTPEAFLAKRQAAMEVGIAALAEAVDAGEVEIDSAAGKPHFRKDQAAERDPTVDKTRAYIADMMGTAQLADIILEIDALTNFSEILLDRKPSSEKELLALYGALLAHGTEMDAKGVAAMIPGLEVAHISVAMRTLEAGTRLRDANNRVAEFQRKQPVAAIWSDGTKASSDMMALDTTRHLAQARTDPRRRTYAVGIYTHVLGSFGVIHDIPIVLNVRQHMAAAQGVETYNLSDTDRIKIDLLAVDTHGYTFSGMAMGKLLGFDLCPGILKVAQERMVILSGMKVPESLERLRVDVITAKRIVKVWDEMLRIVASIRTRRVSVAWMLERLGTYGHDDPVTLGFENLGMLLRTEFQCEYLTNPAFRIELRTLLNRGESVHALQRAIYYGRVTAERGRREDELRAISGSHVLLTNIVIAWNTLKIQEVVARLAKAGQKVDETILRRIGPVQYGGINFRGLMSFGIDRYVQTLLNSKVTKATKTAGAA